LENKNSENFSYVVPNGAWSSWPMLRPPISSVLDLREGLRGDSDA